MKRTIILPALITAFVALSPSALPSPTTHTPARPLAAAANRASQRVITPP